MVRRTLLAGVPSRFLPAAVLILAALGACAPLAPRGERPPGYPLGYHEQGFASWYGPGFHGNRTASGEVFDMRALTAAHRTLPFGAVVRVRSLTSGRTVLVRINDRGPFARGRILDVSQAAARALGMLGEGTHRVDLRVVRYEGDGRDPGALWVQVASFGDETRARVLAAELGNRYGGARIVTAELPEGRRYRVQVGRFASQEAAQAAADRIEREWGMEPLVVR
ncbi:septal ring lytic transglycosylase RlpA family protein [Candidatus Nitrospira bockiana]